MGTNTLEKMHSHIKTCLSDIFARAAIQKDFSNTFQNIGVGKQDAERLTDRIFNDLTSNAPIQEIEGRLYDLLSRTKINAADTKTLTTAIDEKLQGRAKIIHSQVSPHFAGVTGKVIDYGAGDGQVTQLLSNEGLDISGVDVRSYASDNISVPIEIFDGYHVSAKDFEFEAGLATNVFHHETDNDKCLSELSRIVRNKLVIIETVPVGKTQAEIRADYKRTFMNDYLYNRLLHNPDFNVPVPGSYETPEGWINRIENYGWRLEHSEDLGIDLPVIADNHHLLVFER